MDGCVRIFEEARRKVIAVGRLNQQWWWSLALADGDGGGDKKWNRIYAMERSLFLVESEFCKKKKNTNFFLLLNSKSSGHNFERGEGKRKSCEWP